MPQGIACSICFIYFSSPKLLPMQRDGLTRFVPGAQPVWHGVGGDGAARCLLLQQAALNGGRAAQLWMRSHQWAFLWNCLAMAGVELEAWLCRSFCLPDSSRAACTHLALCPGSVCAMGLCWGPCPCLKHTAPIPSGQGALWMPGANLALGASQSCEHEGVCISHVVWVPRVTGALCHPKSSQAVGVGGVRWGHYHLCHPAQVGLLLCGVSCPRTHWQKRGVQGVDRALGATSVFAQQFRLGLGAFACTAQEWGVKKENGLGRKAHSLCQLAVSWKLGLLFL